MGVCTHKEVYPTNEVLSSSSKLKMSTTALSEMQAKALHIQVEVLDVVMVG